MKRAAILIVLMIVPVRADVDVPLTVDIPAGITSERWPVTFGVPFPKDALRPGDKLVVSADGKPILTQTSPLATWDKDGQSVRWLLVDCQIDAAHPPKNLRLITGQWPVSPLKCRRDGGAFVVETGAMAFRVQTKPLTVACEALAQPMRFTLADHKGMAYAAEGSDSFTIEDEGPARIAIKSEGWYRADNGTTFCRHVTRLQFHANSPLVRVLHTFIMTESGAEHQVRDVAIDLPMAGHGASFGIDADDLARVHRVDGDAFLVQDCVDRWHLTWQLHEGNGVTARGERGSGWISRKGMTIALREAWQNYPYELEAREDRLVVHLWPLHGRMLDFRTRAVLAPYGEDGIAVIDKFFSGQPKPYTKSLDEIDNNAMGVAKTHELWLDFQKDASDIGRTAAVAQQANMPVLAASDPAWNCASGAFVDIIHPRKNPATFPEVEAALDAMFDRFTYWQHHFSDYGWFDYGDVHCDARGDRFDTKLKGGPMATPWRYWDSTHYGLPNGPWTLYFRSGLRKYLEFAEANARHCMDIDRCHYGDDKQRILGANYYCDWSIIHWNGVPSTYVWLTAYDKLEYLAYAYYMRGDRRAFDVFRTYGEAVARYHDDPSQQFPLRMLKPDYQDIRHLGPQLGNLTELYRITWDERYLRIARDYAQAIAAIMPDEKTLTGNLGGIAYCWEGMARYLAVTGDTQFLDTARKYAIGAAVRGSDRFDYDAYALAYLWTHDTAMLDFGKSALMQQLSVLNVSDDPVSRGDGGYWACGDHPFTLRSLPVFLAAMVAAPQSWRDANLPLTPTNLSAHFAGPRLPVIYVKPTGSGTPRVAFQLMQEQAIQLNDADPLIEAPPQRRVELDATQLKNGVNTIRFPLRPTRKVDDYIDRGNVNLIAAENVKLVLGPGAEDGKFCVFGPRLYFLVPHAVDQFTVTVQVSDTWAAYAWKPSVHMFDPEGAAVMTKTGPGTLQFTVEPRPEHRGRCWSIGPIGRVSAPQETATWNKPPYPLDKHFPSYITLSSQLPQWLSTRADLMFDPSAQ